MFKYSIAIKNEQGIAVPTRIALRIPKVHSMMIMTNRVEMMTLFCKSDRESLIFLD